MPTLYQGKAGERQALDTFIKLMRAAESLARRTRAVMTEHALSESQFGVMEALYHRGPMHQARLGKKILKSKGNITLVLNNLEKQGWICRDKTESDKRFNKVALSVSGRELIRKIFPAHAALIRKEMAVLNPIEIKQLGRLCKKLGLGHAPSEGRLFNDSAA